MNRLIKLSIIIGLGAILWLIPPPFMISPEGWKVFSVFICTILGFILRPWPQGVMAILGITILAISKLGSMKDLLSGFADPTVWLIVSAVFFSHGIMRSGLGKRIAYVLIKRFGTSTLKLGYAMACADLVVSPVTISNTARGTGIIYPILKDLILALGKEGTEGRRSAASYLVLNSMAANTYTITIFLTACSGNLLVVSLGAKLFNYTITWWQWFLVGILPGMLSLIIIPWFIHTIYPPHLKDTSKAVHVAEKALQELGPMSRNEWITAGIFVMCILLWSTSQLTGLHPALVSFMGIMGFLISDILTWDEILKESGGWDILIWMGSLICMAGLLGKYGVIQSFTKAAAASLGGLDWFYAAIFVYLIYAYSQYFFASGNVRITALFTALASLLVGLGAPVFYTIMMFGLMNSPGCTLTHYSSALSPVFYGSGYVTLKDWWRVGFFVSIVSYVLHFWVGTGVMMALQMMQ